jgi:DNA mismatch repair protein MutS
MRVDKQTQRDLEIFKPDEGEVSLFDFINKTKTAGGKYRLEDKFRHPPDSLEKIKVQQETVSYLIRNISRFTLPFNDQQIKSVENYISTNIEPIKGESIFECLKFCISDIKAYRYLKSSVLELTVFINTFFGLFEDKKEELPANMKMTHKELDFFINHESFKKIHLIPQKRIFAFLQVLRCDKQLRTNLKSNLSTILMGYYEIDALLSMANATLDNHFGIPEFLEHGENIFSAEGLYYPLLANAIPADISLTSDKNFVFITGPNMSGKTTFLKAVGISIYLAHLGMGVPAENAKMTYFDHLFSSINITGNILKGYSFFFSEVKRVKELAESLKQGENVFSLIDELFRGTNVKDAYDASVMIISGLAQWRRSAFVLTSHLWEIWEKIKVYPNIKDLSFESEIINGAPVFTYRLVSGVCDMRLGLKIIENEKIMDLLNQPLYDKN